MIRSFRIHMFSALAVAVMLPVAAYAAQGTAKSSTTAPKAPATHAMSATATTHHHSARLASHTKRAPAVDINSASKEDLMKLPGITDEVAEKIIAGRPYKTKAELTKKNVLTKAEYGKVRSRVTAKQETKAPEAKSMESTPETKAPETKAPETKAPDSK